MDTGTRFKSTFDFGFVNLCLEDVQCQRDEGNYTVRAWNKHGEAFTSCVVYVEDKGKDIIYDTQHPKGPEGLDKIAQLEAARAEANKKPGEKELTGIPPKFTTPVGIFFLELRLRIVVNFKYLFFQFENLRNLTEGDLAHFEAQLIPLSKFFMQLLLKLGSKNYSITSQCLKIDDETMRVEWFQDGK